MSKYFIFKLLLYVFVAYICSLWRLLCRMWTRYF